MSTDAWIEEHWIGEAVLPRPRRAPKLPALSVPHAPTCSRGNAALAAHAQSRDSARHPRDGLRARQDGRNVVDQQARKLTQPPAAAYCGHWCGHAWVEVGNHLRGTESLRTPRWRKPDSNLQFRARVMTVSRPPSWRAVPRQVRGAPRRSRL